MTKINARSPYFVYLTESNLESATLDLYIYTGTQTTDRGTAKYNLTSTAVNEKITFEISELVRDYIENTFDGSYASSAVWVDYQITRTVSGTAQTPDAIVELKGFDGYGYFSDGAQNQSADINDQTILQSNKIIYKYSDAPLRLPVNASVSTEITFLQGNEEIYTTTLSAPTTSANLIQYVTSESVSGVDSWQERVLSDQGTVESLECVEDFLEDFDLYGVDKVYVSYGSTVEVYDVVNIEECNHTPYKLTFVNKFGALQDIWFFKRSIESMNTDQETFKSNLVVDGSYSINKHQKNIFTKQGNESMSINSGFYPEDYNEVFKQLLLSESVWIEYELKTLPITIKSSSLTFKDQLNDKLISYQLDIEFSNDLINNIR